MDDYVTVARVGDVPAGGATQVDVGGRKVVLCETCLVLVLIEWRRKKQEFGELSAGR